MQILISGDSWGCGEWGYVDGNYQILHKGLEQYLIEDGHTVTNVSRGRSSNSESIRRLIENLTNETDLIIWFQSDPLRDNPVNNLKSYEDIKNINYKNLQISYEVLNSIGKKIYCIGGCGRLNNTLISQYSNLIPLIESVPTFLYKDFIHPEIWISDFVWNDLYHTLNNEVLENLLKSKQIVDSLHDGTYQDYFQPDGRHPNRAGHYKIYEYVKTYCI